MLLSKGGASAAEGLDTVVCTLFFFFFFFFFKWNTLSRRTPSTHLNHIMQDSSNERNWTPARRSHYRNSFLDTRWITQTVAYKKHNLKIAIWLWASFNYPFGLRDKKISWCNHGPIFQSQVYFCWNFTCILKIKLQCFFCQTHRNKGAEARSCHASVNRLCLGRTLGICGWCLILMCLRIPEWTGQVPPRKKKKKKKKNIIQRTWAGLGLVLGVKTSRITSCCCKSPLWLLLDSDPTCQKHLERCHKTLEKGMQI